MNSTAGSVVDFLSRQGCSYRLLEHEPYTSSEEATGITGVQPEWAAKSLLFEAQGEPVLAVVPASGRVSSAKLRRYLDVRNVCMASPEELEQIMACIPGTCHPLGRIAGIRTVVDVHLAEATEIGFSTGDPGCTVILPFEEYRRVSEAEFTDIIKA